MAKPKLYKFRGSDATRARALARSPRRPKFGLGEVVVDPHGDIGAIDAIYADLQAVEDSGQIDNAAEWRRGLSIKPKTPISGIWYALVYGHGAGVAGELDLRRARVGASSKP